jgi:menaquinone-dependent protoporphyrinogen oxidase
VFYATTEGRRGASPNVLVANLPREWIHQSTPSTSRSRRLTNVDWTHVRAAVVGASLHGHRHQRSAEMFVREHAAELNAHPSAFFSVSLATASSTTAEREAASQIAARLPARAAWHPAKVVCVSGRLAYTSTDW